MAVEITQGPISWSISGAVGAPRHHASFTCTAPRVDDLNDVSKKLKYKITQTEGRDFHGMMEGETWFSPDENGYSNIIWFGIGSYTLQIFEIDKDPDGGEDTVAASSNIVSWEVTA